MRYGASARLFGLPLLSIVLDGKPLHQSKPAVGIIAIGQRAYGVISISQFGAGISSIAQYGIGVFGIFQFGVALKSISQFGFNLLSGRGQAANLGDSRRERVPLP